jgi:YD repeat-containing protein
MTTPLYLKLAYNKRQQLVDLRLSTINDAGNWNRGALVFYYGTNAILNWNPFQDDADNNGNVRRALHYAPLDDQISSHVIPQLQDYAYDELNRISSVSEQQNSNSGSPGAWFPSFSQTFAYDRYGNKRISGATGGVNSYNPTYDTSNNRISNLAYDAAGNITNDPATGGTMIYDGESRLIMATNGGGGAYTYDGEGKRVKRVLAVSQRD